MKDAGDTSLCRQVIGVGRVRTPIPCVIAVLVSTATVLAQQKVDPLPRRGWFGVALAPHSQGAAVTGVVPGSPAAMAGMTAGDVIRAVDGNAVTRPADVVAAMTRHASGTTASIDLLRAGTDVHRDVILRALPVETLAGVA